MREPPSSGPRPPRGRSKPPAPSPGPRVRKGAVKVHGDVAFRIRAGHPWVFRDALGTRPLNERTGASIDLLDPTGGFVGRGLYDPEGAVAVRVFSRDPRVELDAATVKARVERARRLRERLLPPGLGACRVVHGEGDGLPGLTVDKYGDFMVMQLYTAAALDLATQVRGALAEVWQPRSIYVQHRFRPPTGEGPREPAKLAYGEVAPVEVEVDEDGLRFAVDVTAPLGSGLFLDLREGRRAVARLAPGRRVLNLFSYTGAISLHAARAGATEVVSVDLAARAHARARHNLQLNQLSEAGHEFITGDATKVLARMAERSRRFDLVIIDPPSFAQAKGGTVFSAQRDYSDLVAAVLSVLDLGGLVVCASNTAKLSLEEFDRVLGDGAHKAQRALSIVQRVGLPVDFPVPAGFPEGHYLKLLIGAAS